MVLSEAIPITATAWVSPRLNPSYEKRLGAAGKTVAPTKSTGGAMVRVARATKKMATRRSPKTTGAAAQRTPSLRRAAGVNLAAEEGSPKRIQLFSWFIMPLTA
ncbi:hypothetical protein Pssp01_04890 [Pseudomonas sp. NBRC 100443]|nr:hypothetical protein Pssp01_04890 [Pseudomonas sp. NBRC 100443]